MAGTYSPAPQRNIPVSTHRVAQRDIHTRRVRARGRAVGRGYWNRSRASVSRIKHSEEAEMPSRMVNADSKLLSPYYRVDNRNTNLHEKGNRFAALSPKQPAPGVGINDIDPPGRAYIIPPSTASQTAPSLPKGKSSQNQDTVLDSPLFIFASSPERPAAKPETVQEKFTFVAPSLDCSSIAIDRPSSPMPTPVTTYPQRNDHRSTECVPIPALPGAQPGSRPYPPLTPPATPPESEHDYFAPKRDPYGSTPKPPEDLPLANKKSLTAPNLRGMDCPRHLGNAESAGTEMVDDVMDKVQRRHAEVVAHHEQSDTGPTSTDHLSMESGTEDSDEGDWVGRQEAFWMQELGESDEWRGRGRSE
ncbi:MAG: hypothetical protein Q9164_000667 [Protoblastenia rupestris]